MKADNPSSKTAKFTAIPQQKDNTETPPVPKHSSRNVSTGGTAGFSEKANCQRSGTEESGIITAERNSQSWIAKGSVKSKSRYFTVNAAVKIPNPKLNTAV
ncbi:hypothetical protein FACS18942_10930 [Planctomycetales bacterium]|nr:hypothetical protein FACS18942_10930 [Planctomycetales bacterium]